MQELRGQMYIVMFIVLILVALLLAFFILSNNPSGQFKILTDFGK